MAWVTTTTLGYAIGSGQVTALFSGDASTFAQFELEARATVVAVMQHAGYSAPADTLTAGTVSTGFLMKLVHALIEETAYSSRKGIQAPAGAAERIASARSLLDAIYQKKLPIPGLEPDTLAGIGGSKFSPTTGDDARARAFALRGTTFATSSMDCQMGGDSEWPDALPLPRRAAFTR